MEGASLIIDDAQRTKRSAPETPCQISELSVDAILREYRELFNETE